MVATTPEQVRSHHGETGHYLGDEPTSCELCAVAALEVKAARKARRAHGRKMDAAVTNALRWAGR